MIDQKNPVVINNVNFTHRWDKIKSKNIDGREYIIERRGEIYRITQRELINAGIVTRHYSCTLNINGELVNSQFTSVTVDQVFSRFSDFGHTEAFILNIENVKLNDHELLEKIIHKKTSAERNFTATGDKLNFHWPIFKKLANTGFGSIIRATVTLHQVCSSKCQFCSTVGRNKKDSVSLEEAKSFIKSLYFDQEKFNEAKFPEYNDLYRKETGTGIRLKGLILSGGGQPNLWPHFEEFVRFIKEETDIELGLITNGFPKNIDDNIYSNFKWIRISITPPDASAFYPNGDFRGQYFPETLGHNGQTVGLSYVYGPWTTDNEILTVDEFAKIRNFEYVRVLTDCNLSRHSQLQSHDSLAKKLFYHGLIDSSGNPLSKTFHQLKYHANKAESEEVWTSGQCYLQTYNAFWDTTGHEENGYSYIYPCDSVTVLSEEGGAISERKFNHERWGTYTNINVDKLFTEPVRSFFDPKENCTACLFIKNNQTVKKLMSNEVSLTDIIPPEHVNFP